MYSLLVAATVLFTVQFLFQQQYRKSHGAGLEAMLNFSFCTGCIGCLLMLVLNGFHLRITAFAVGMAIAYSVSSLLNVYFALKAFTTANLSVFSVFSMLGGMLLPFALGIAFYGEPLTVSKVLCCALIAGAVLLTIEKGERKSGGLRYCFGVFFFNGMSGVLSKIHQSNALQATDSYSFMALANLGNVLLCLALLLAVCKTHPQLKGREPLFVSGYAVCCAIGNLFCLIALTVLPASVQYPIITGGVIVGATIVSLLKKERPSHRNLAAAGVAFLASVLIAL